MALAVALVISRPTLSVDPWGQDIKTCLAEFQDQLTVRKIATRYPEEAQQPQNNEERIHA
jgi:hypothetical protein